MLFILCLQVSCLCPQPFPPHRPVDKQDPLSGEPQLHTDGDVLQIAFGKDGWLHSVEEHGILRKWNPISGQQLDWSSLSDMESLWVFSLDARVLASASDDLAIWRAPPPGRF